jgi:hypothetical protein
MRDGALLSARVGVRRTQKTLLAPGCQAHRHKPPDCHRIRTQRHCLDNICVSPPHARLPQLHEPHRPAACPQYCQPP